MQADIECKANPRHSNISVYPSSENAAVASNATLRQVGIARNANS